MRRASPIVLLLALACGDRRLTTLHAPRGGVGADGGGQMPSDCSRDLFGFATLGTGTVGGAGGERVVVTTAQQFQDYAGRAQPVYIQVQGMITLSGQVNVKSKKTIVGLGPASGFESGGLALIDVSDVIIRNLKISKVIRDDTITIDGSHNVWVDHCDLSSELDPPGGSEYYDGLVDIIKGSDNVTVSWTYFHHHNHTSLIGHDDQNAAMDMGHLNVTFHHNWFDTTDSYNPSIRFGTLHAFNNYYVNVNVALLSRMGALVLAEANYFDNVRNPLRTDDDGTPGTITEKGPNIYMLSPLKPYTQGIDWAPTYDHKADEVGDVPELVPHCAGTGKIAP
jgi:pectate lyase